MKMLQTAVHEIKTAAELEKIINSTLTDSFKNENENVMVCAGRMGPMCIPVYDAMEELEEEYTNVKFYSMGFWIHRKLHLFEMLPCVRVLWFYLLRFTIKMIQW